MKYLFLLSILTLVIHISPAHTSDGSEAFATPHLFRVMHGDKPVAHIFPTVHTTGLCAIPEVVRNEIARLASLDDSTVYTEIDAAAEVESASGSCEVFLRYLKSTKFRLTEERVRALTTKNYGSSFKYLEKCISEEMAIYEAGWTSKLGEDLIEFLQRYSKSDALDIQENGKRKLDDADPNYFYYYLIGIRNELSDSQQQFISIDDEIEQLFREQGRSLAYLEDQTVRDYAEFSEMLNNASAHHLSLTLSTAVDMIKINLNDLRKILEPAEPHVPVVRTRDDIDFEDAIVRQYLEEGAISPLSSFGADNVMYRNLNWWEEKIKPLLDTRAASEDALPPVLFVYGAAHNCGRASILDLIVVAGYRLEALGIDGQYHRYGPDRSS